METEMIEAEIRGYTYKQLCDMYKMSRYCFKTQIADLWDELGERRGILFSARQVAIIFRELGRPMVAVKKKITIGGAP
jgi:hypothetical protein